MERTLEKFSEKLCEGLPEGSTCLFGSLGIGYLNVLVPLQGKMLVVGEFIWDFWYRQNQRTDETNTKLFNEFREAILKSYNEQIQKDCKEIPSLHYRDAKIGVYSCKPYFKPQE